MLNSNMFRSIKLAAFAACIAATLVVAANAQVNTTGTVTMTGTVSKFVELNSGGAVTLAGNSGGTVTTNGTADTLLGVVVNLGELGPANTNSFVTLSVPLKLRSNSTYNLSMSATVVSSGTTANKLTSADVGFGLGSTTRSGVGVAAGTDTNATSGDPTSGANGAADVATGRWTYSAGKTNLGAFSSSTLALSGPAIMNAVPRSNANGMTVPAIFSVKPQFYEVGTSTITVNFTATAP